MGEARKDALGVNFDRKLRLEFHGVKVTSDAGLLAYREIDDVLGLTDMSGNRTCLTAQDDFSKKIDVVQRNLCFLSVQMGNLRFRSYSQRIKHRRSAKDAKTATARKLAELVWAVWPERR